MIPQTFNDWKNCIVNDCKINLTKDLAQQSLRVYRDGENQETQKFTGLYEEAYLQKIINWFTQI